MVALSATDFGNFITHPLMKPPSPPMTSTSNNKLTFLKENVSVNPSSGTVLFYGMYGGSKWLFTLQRAAESSQKAKITASLASINVVERLAGVQQYVYSSKGWYNTSSADALLREKRKLAFAVHCPSSVTRIVLGHQL